MEDIKRPSPRQPTTDQYKTSTLIKVWLRILRKILRRTGNRILRDPRLAAVLILFIAVSIWGITQLVSDNVNPIPSKYRKGLNFTLYYPSRLPNGYAVDQSSYKRQGNVLIFSIKSPNGKNVAVSEQVVPVNLPAHQTSSAPIQVPGEKSFSTPVGSAHISLWGDKYVADIVTPQTWIILNLTGFTTDQAQSISQSFTGL